MMQTGRDFLGYGARPPNPRWPGGARLAVSFVVNVEEGAELSITDGDERNEATYEVADEVPDVPDPCRDTHFEYGTRVGYWRIMRLLDAYGARSTLNACGRRWRVRRGWRKTGRRAGMRLRAMAGDGNAMPAWSRSGTRDDRPGLRRDRGGDRRRSTRLAHTVPPSVNTRRLLLEHGGFLYDSDAYSDDLPFFVAVGDRSASGPALQFRHQ